LKREDQLAWKMAGVAVDKVAVEKPVQEMIINRIITTHQSPSPPLIAARWSPHAAWRLAMRRRRVVRRCLA
jgi:hypothetical protein